MALKDSSGRITIDEQAAQADIRRIGQAVDYLENSKRAIDNILNQASDERGRTADAIVVKTMELGKQIQDMIARLNETSSFISRTVAHYQEVDRQVKEAIQNSMNGTGAAAVAESSSKPANQPATPKPSASGTPQQSSGKKTNKNSLIEDVADAVADAFKKWF